MKTGIKILLSGCMLMYCISKTYGQSGVVASGADLSGSNLKVSYSMGQVDYITVSGPECKITEGIQQPYEIYIVKGKDLTNINLSVYPNPSAGHVTLSIDEKQTDLHNMSFLLYDRIGQLIMQQTITTPQTGINLKDKASAMYILKVLKDNQELKTFKIINYK